MKLIQTALMGTARQESQGSATGTPVDALLAGLEAGEAERKLLLLAGAWTIYKEAGQTAQPVPAPPAAAPEERQRICSPGAAQLIDEMLSGQHADLLPEALARLKESDLRLPPSLLPAALSARSTEVRPAIMEVLGERGRWLSQFNPDWQWVSETILETAADDPANAETIWQEGTPAQRLAILRRVRAGDPAKARTWIAEVWRQEKADYRGQLLQALEVGLSVEDEPFLEQALDDRSSAVRTQAAALLPRIAGSALARRMRERADALLQWTPPAPPSRGLQGLVRSVLPGSSSPGTLTVVLPEAIDKSWQRDGIDARPPQGLGERAWWLVQALALVPPAHWEARFDAKPAELLAAAQRDEWGTAVIEGWSRATILHRATNWAPRLWEWWYTFKSRDDYYARVAWEMLSALPACLTREDAEHLAARMIKQRATTSDHRWEHIVRALPAPWSVDFSTIYVQAILDDVRKDPAQSRNTAGAWRPNLDAVARAIPPECFGQVLQQWTADEARDVDWYFGRFVETLQVRQRIHQEIKP